MAKLASDDTFLRLSVTKGDNLTQITMVLSDAQIKEYAGTDLVKESLLFMVDDVLEGVRRG